MSKVTRRLPKPTDRIACIHRFYSIDEDYISNTAVGLYHLKYVVLSRNIFKAKDVVSEAVCFEDVGGNTPVHVIAFAQMIDQGHLPLPRFKIMLGQTVDLRNLGEITEAFCKPEYSKKVRQKEGYPPVAFLLDDSETRFISREYGKETLGTLLNDLKTFRNAP